MVKSKKPKTKLGDNDSLKKKDAKLLPKFTLLFLNRPRLTAILWLAVFLFGIASYATLLKREGFPSINFPLASVSGTYIVNDAAKVDQQVSKPLSDLALSQDGVKNVRAQAYENFFFIFIQYDENINAQEAIAALQSDVKKELKLPPQAQIEFSAPQFGVTGGDEQKIDLAISYYKEDNSADTATLTAQAKTFAEQLKSKNLSLVEDVFVKDPFETATNPLTGQAQTVQKSFDRYGTRQDEQNKFFKSVIVAVTAKEGADTIKLDEQVSQAVAELNSENGSNKAVISASFAPNIKENISELQRVLLEGLLAVLIIGSIVIAIRASFITVISMITVLAGTLGLMYAIGYSLNVITLFAIILSLSLIVDDTIIMVEAIDAQRKKQKDARRAVEVATRKVSRAMIAATSTAALSFAPLIFVGGILGSFIRTIPITIISALVISLLVALVFIPFFARFLLLGKNQMGEGHVKEVAAGLEAKIASFISRPMQWAKGHTKRLFFVGLTAVFVGFGFIAAGGFISKNVVFNIFPPSKDANDIQVTLTFAPGTNIDQAQAVTDRANKIVGDSLGFNFEQASYYGLASAESAPMQVKLISYSKRDQTASQIIDQLKGQFANFNGAKVSFSQIDAGPPASGFTVRIESEDRETSFKLANDIAKYLENKQLTRPSGKTAQIIDVTVSSPASYTRTDGVLGVTVGANFDGTDTTTLVTLTQSELEKAFPPEKVQSYGLKEDALKFDIGQESDNQESFKTLAIAFPLLLLVIFVVLAIQFKSLLQPLLIFMAIPFSFFGIALGLSLTNNPFSFFAMLGFFALIGLSIKNTILLTDYANQARRAGMGAVDAACEALKERFRPLIATSLTAVVSLIPLALQSPFWEGLAVVLIFGLLSSTILVITVFPYYYLGAEYLRAKISRKQALAWLIITAALAAAVGKFVSINLVGLVISLALLFGLVYLVYKTRRQKA